MEKSPKYKITERSLKAYVEKNFIAGRVIVGENEDAYYTQKGNKVEPLQKKTVSEWSLKHGYIEGMGFNSLSEQDQGTFIANRAKNATVEAERDAAKGYTTENLEAYKAQTKEGRLENARNNKAKGSEVQPWKGNKGYSGEGTNR